MILAESEVIHSHDLPDKLGQARIATTDLEGFELTLEEMEREHIKRILTKVGGDKAKAAEILGIHLSTLYRKVQRLKLEDIKEQPPAGMLAKGA